MALDTKQKRGSALNVSMPFRQWLAEPDGTLASTDRVSLLKLTSAVTPAGGEEPVATVNLLHGPLRSPLLRGLIG